MHTNHGKQRAFTAELVAILQREALLQHVNLSKSNNNLIEEKEKLEKKLKATDVRLKSSKVDSGKTEQLRKEYDLKVIALGKCELHINKLQGELKDAREQAEQLQSAADSNSQVDNLQQALKEEIERTTQLKTALESKQRHIKKIEESSLEANNTLEGKIQETEKHVLALRQDNHTLQNKNVSLQKELDSAKQLNNQINATKEQTQSSFKQISLQNQVQVTEIVNLKLIQGSLEQKISHLNFKIKDLEEREKIYKGTEEFYERNFRDIANKTSHAAQAIEELKILHRVTQINPYNRNSKTKEPTPN